VLGIRDILVRIRIPGSVPLTNGSGSGSDYFLQGCKKKYFFAFFLITCPQVHHLQTKTCNFLLKFCVNILFCRHYVSPLNTFMRKGKIPEPDPDPQPDPGGLKSCGSRSPTLLTTVLLGHATLPYLFLFNVTYRREAVLALPGFIPIFSSRTPFGQLLVRKQTYYHFPFSTYGMLFSRDRSVFTPSDFMSSKIHIFL
jgi:hypothetical protein